MIYQRLAHQIVLIYQTIFIAKLAINNPKFTFFEIIFLIHYILSYGLTSSFSLKPVHFAFVFEKGPIYGGMNVIET